MVQSNTEIDKKTIDSTKATVIERYTNYVIDGKHFEVERVFNESASDTLGMTLLKLIKAEIIPF